MKQSKKTFTFTVDYGLSLQEMIDLGHYDWVNPGIASEFCPHDMTLGKTQVTAKLFTVGGLSPAMGRGAVVMSRDAVLSNLDRPDLRPATMEELMAFGAAFPNEQRNGLIAAFGSVWHSGWWPVVGIIYQERSERDLGTHKYNNSLAGGWLSTERFLAITIGQVPQLDEEWEERKRQVRSSS
jgi:hypothetical protein